MNYEPFIYAFAIFLLYIIINIISDFLMSIINRIYYNPLFRFDLILNNIDVDHDRISDLLHMKKYEYLLYLKGIFLFNREQILTIATYLNIDPNNVYSIKII